MTTTLKEKKTSLRKTAGISLKSVDLIHPHEKSNLPGYCGYTSQLKYNCGHTYGYHTDKLLNKNPNSTDLFRTASYEAPPSSRLLPSIGAIQDETGDQKYCEKMVPGYTGFVPQHKFKYGRTYKEGTEEAILDFKNTNIAQGMDYQELKDTVSQKQKLVISPDYPKPDPSHPGVNVRHAFSYNYGIFGDRKEFTEAPIPNYMGYVPKNEEHKLGGRFGHWTRNAYTDAWNSMVLHEQRQTQKIIPGDDTKHDRSLTWPAQGPGTNQARYGSVYNKRLGMVPRYTGYVPQFRYDMGNTYGDASRNLPVCYDTPGYATGVYNSKGPIIEQTVIPVRI